MHPADIQSEIKKRGITQKEIAAGLGVSEMAVSKEIAGDLVSERIRVAIADAIGRDKHEVFPHYYFSKKRRIKAA